MLKFQLENLEGVDESLHNYYEKTDSGFRLKVDGLEDVSGLKSALDKERNSNKDAKTRLTELEKQREDAEKKVLEEQGKYKDLSERERTEKLEAQKLLTELTQKVAKGNGDLMIKKLSASLTSDPVEQSIIERFAQDYLEFDGDTAKFNKDEKDIITELSRFVRSKASDAPDKGNNDRGGGNADKYKGMSSTELMKQGRNK